MRSKSQILSKLRADGHITDEKYKLLEKEPKMVHRETLEQVMWERDVAINQLKELGYGLGEKPKTGHWCRKTKVDAYDIAGVKTWGIKCQCDRCDFATIVVEDFGYYKYCPNCGAKMEV